MIYVYPMGAIRDSQTFVKSNYLKINIDGIMHSLMSPCNLCSKNIFWGPIRGNKQTRNITIFLRSDKKNIYYSAI